MGAALILQALATDAPLCAVIAESPFSSFREVSFDRVGAYLGMGPWFGRTLGRLPIELAFLYARARYGVNLGDASPLRAIEGSKVPVLLIHGALDTNILPRHSWTLFNAAPSHMRLWIVPGAAHTGAWATAPVEFERNVLDWFRAPSTSGHKVGM